MDDSDSDDSVIRGVGKKRGKGRAQGGPIKHVRWGEEKNEIFRKEMQFYTDNKKMPSGQTIDKLTLLLKNRTKAPPVNEVVTDLIMTAIQDETEYNSKSRATLLQRQKKTECNINREKREMESAKETLIKKGKVVQYEEKVC